MESSTHVDLQPRSFSSRYYINEDHEREKREQMEAWWGTFWDLRRHPAADARDPVGGYSVVGDLWPDGNVHLYLEMDPPNSHQLVSLPLSGGSRGGASRGASNYPTSRLLVYRLPHVYST